MIAMTSPSATVSTAHAMSRFDSRCGGRVLQVMDRVHRHGRRRRRPMREMRTRCRRRNRRVARRRRPARPPGRADPTASSRLSRDVVSRGLLVGPAACAPRLFATEQAGHPTRLPCMVPARGDRCMDVPTSMTAAWPKRVNCRLRTTTTRAYRHRVSLHGCETRIGWRSRQRWRTIGRLAVRMLAPRARRGRAPRREVRGPVDAARDAGARTTAFVRPRGATMSAGAPGSLVGSR
jgi:hypothetical protein